MIAPTKFSVKVTWYSEGFKRHDSIVHVESVGAKDAKRYAVDFVSQFGTVGMITVKPLQGATKGIKAAWYRY